MGEAWCSLKHQLESCLGVNLLNGAMDGDKDMGSGVHTASLLARLVAQLRPVMTSTLVNSVPPHCGGQGLSPVGTRCTGEEGERRV